jgi:hypothetical protein
VNGTTLFEA